MEPPEVAHESCYPSTPMTSAPIARTWIRWKHFGRLSNGGYVDQQPRWSSPRYTECVVLQWDHQINLSKADCKHVRTFRAVIVAKVVIRNFECGWLNLWPICWIQCLCALILYILFKLLLSEMLWNITLGAANSQPTQIPTSSGFFKVCQREKFNIQNTCILQWVLLQLTLAVYGV